MASDGIKYKLTKLMETFGAGKQQRQKTYLECEGEDHHRFEDTEAGSLVANDWKCFICNSKVVSKVEEPHRSKGNKLRREDLKKQIQPLLDQLAQVEDLAAPW